MPASDVSHGSSYLYSPTGPRLPSQPQVVTAVNRGTYPQAELTLVAEVAYRDGVLFWRR